MLALAGWLATVMNPDRSGSVVQEASSASRGSQAPRQRFDRSVIADARS